jgi:hypothetical protein
MPRGAELSPGERRIVLAVWSFLEKNEGKDIFRRFNRRRKLVAAVTGLGPNTVDRVRKLALEGGEAALESRAQRPGRPRIESAEAVTAARAVIRSNNHAVARKV